MSILMFGATVLLTLSGVCFAGLYLWLNIFSSLPDLADRSKNALSVSRVSVILSLVFALLNSVITDKASVEAIEASALLFTIISISYLVVALACGVALICTLVSRYSYRRGLGGIVGRMFLLSSIGGAVALAFAWLLG